MFTITPKSLTTALLVTFVWIVGGYELYDTITHFSEQWYWYPLALIYTVALNDCFVHMCCGHALYEIDTTRIGYKITSFLATVENGWGPITTLCLIHKNHHMYSDQGNKDCSNWRNHWYNMSLLSPSNYIYQEKTEYPDADNFFKKQREVHKNILDDLWTFFIEEYSNWLTVLYWIVLYFVCPIFLFKIVFMGRFLMSLISPFASITGHVWLPTNYRNFNTPDTSYNNIIFYYLTLGIYPTAIQNNHHGMRYSLKTGHKVRWFEFDLSVYIVKFLKYFTEKRGAKIDNGF